MNSLCEFLYLFERINCFCVYCVYIEKIFIILMQKLSVYIDTNIIFDFFLNLSKSFRNEQELELPRKLVFLIGQQEKQNIKLLTSILTQAEISRRLKSEYGFHSKDIEEFWLTFINISGTDMIEEIEIDWKELLRITTEVPLKKRVTNLQHLMIAKHYNMWFLTGDKEIFGKLKKFYDKIISYTELRKLIESKHTSL